MEIYKLEIVEDKSCIYKIKNEYYFFIETSERWILNYSPDITNIEGKWVEDRDLSIKLREVNDGVKIINYGLKIYFYLDNKFYFYKNHEFEEVSADNVYLYLIIGEIDDINNYPEIVEYINNYTFLPK